MRVIIHTSELASWQERANRNEILISGMTFPHNGKVELDYTETPHMADNFMRVGIAEEASARKLCAPSAQADAASLAAGGSTPPPAPFLAHGNTSPSLSPAPAAVPPTAEVRVPLMVKCADCGLERREDEECMICSAMLRIREKARYNRRLYHLEKSYQRSEAWAN